MGNALLTTEPYNRYRGVGENAPHRITFTGPGILIVTLGTASRTECQQRAPDMARELKREQSVRWVAWEIVAR